MICRPVSNYEDVAILILEYKRKDSYRDSRVVMEFDIQILKRKKTHF